MARPTSGRPVSAKNDTIAASGASRLTNSVIVAPKLKEFVFTEKLGSGSYATVYKAYRKGGHREVAAIKCVKKSSLTKRSTENLLTEIELLKKLKHENIVELKDFQWDDAYIYLIMEYSSGGDLSHFLRSKRMLPEHIVRRFLRQIASAMEYLRQHEVAHMDLKPQNILLTSPSDPVIKIADFGFAKYLFEGDELHALRGSPLYMAPEIICKGQYDARVDLWSIGVILYECLFGRAPYASRSFKELQDKIWDPKPVELPYGIQVSDSCRDMVLRLLKRDPNDRIEFEDFFNHPFLDLKHVPSPDCLKEAKHLVKEAVGHDEKGDYTKAVKLYCEAVEFFVPAVRYEKDETKKAALRIRVKEYMDRAEQLKQMLKPQKHKSDGTLQRTESTDTRQELLELYKDSERMTAALKLVQAAIVEEENEDFESAMKHYEMALGTAIDTMKTEKKGRRKDLLREQVPIWMTKAEEIKSYLDVRKLNTSKDSDRAEQEEASEKSILGSGQCLVQ